MAISEAWLNKVNDRELTALNAAADQQVFSRDVYSFWAPLDARSLSALVRFAHAQELEFVSPFWSKYFYAYLDYDAKTAALNAPQRVAAHVRLCVPSLIAGKFSQTARAYQKTIADHQRAE